MTEFFQALYTSCENGLTGTKGFQFHAASRELDARLLQKLEKLCTYIPPASAPSQPTNEQLRVFPVSLIFCQLPELGYVTAQIKYIGQDYTGRYGNYFVHALVSKNQKPFEEYFLPIELWHAEFWKEKAEEPSIVLSNLASDQAKAGLDLSELDKFFLQSDREGRMSEMIAAAIDSVTSKRPIVIIDDNDNVALWVAALTNAFPRNLALPLSFNTYVTNPRQADFRIMGLSPDNDPQFSTLEMEHQYFVFDFVRNKFSPIKKIPAFAKNIAHIYGLRRVDAVSYFNTFIANKNLEISIRQLDAAYFIYAFAKDLDIIDFDFAKLSEFYETQFGSFDGEFAKKFFARLKELKQFDRALLKSCTNLYSAAQKQKPPFANDYALKLLMEDLYIDWIFQEALNKCQAGDFLKEWSEVHFPESTIDKAKKHQDAWYDLCQKTSEPGRLLDLLYVGQRFRFLGKGSKKLQQIGAKNIAPQLSDPAFLQGFIKSATPGSTVPAELKDIVQGIGAYFAQRKDDPALAHLSNSPLIAAEFKSYAMAEDDVEFYAYLVRLKASDYSDKTKYILGCFDDVKHQQAQFIPRLFDHFIEKYAKSEKIDWPQMAAWCSYHLDLFNNILYVEFVEKLLNHAMQQSPDKLLVEKLTQVYEYSRRLNENSKVRNKVETLYLHWFFERKINPEFVVPLFDNSVFKNPPLQPTAELIQAWLSPLKNAAGKVDSSWLFAYLKLGEKLGFLAKPLKDLEKISEEIIGPRLGEKSAQDALKILVETDFNEKKLNAKEPAGWNNILNGVGAFICHDFKTRCKRFLEPIYDSTGVREGLKSFAASNQRSDLLLALVKYEFSKKDQEGDSAKVTHFKNNIEYFAKSKTNSRDKDINQLFDMLWGKEKLDVRIAREIADILKDKKSCTPILFTRLYDALTAKLEAYAFERSHFLLAGLLLHPPFRTFLEGRAPLLEAIAAISKLKDGEDKALVNAVSCFIRLQDEKPNIEKFDDRIALSLVMSEDVEEHSRCLAELNRVTNKKFLKIYIENVLSFCGGKSTLEKRRYIAQFFRSWTAAFSNDRESFDNLVKSTLPKLLVDDDLQAIPEYFQKDSQVRARWDESLKRARGFWAGLGGKFFSKTKSAEAEINLQED